MSAVPTASKPSVDRAGLIERRARFLSPSLRTFPLYADDPLVLVRGEGAHVYDEAGRRYLDGTAQNVCISLGFAHPVTQAMVAGQMARMQHCTSLFYNEEPVRYAEELVARMPAGDWVVHLVNSGAEAIDLAYAMARAHTGHFEMVSLRNAYHGLHFGASGSAAFAPCRLPTAAMQGFVHAMHPDQYKGAFGPDAGVEPYLAELERTIFSSTSGRIAGMIVEPIQGFGGVVPMPPGYMRRAFEIVHQAYFNRRRCFGCDSRKCLGGDCDHAKGQHNEPGIGKRSAGKAEKACRRGHSRLKSESNRGLRAEADAPAIMRAASHVLL